MVLLWTGWSWVFFVYWRSLDRYTALRRAFRWLLAGTMLELLLAAPAQALIVSSRNEDCYCELGPIPVWRSAARRRCGYSVRGRSCCSFASGVGGIRLSDSPGRLRVGHAIMACLMNRRGPYSCILPVCGVAPPRRISLQYCSSSLLARAKPTSSDRAAIHQTGPR